MTPDTADRGCAHADSLHYHREAAFSQGARGLPGRSWLKSRCAHALQGNSSGQDRGGLRGRPLGGSGTLPRIRRVQGPPEMRALTCNGLYVFVYTVYLYRSDWFSPSLANSWVSLAPLDVGQRHGGETPD